MCQASNGGVSSDISRRTLRLTVAWGAVAGALCVAYFGYQVAILASMILGAGASGGAGMVLELFRPVGHFALGSIAVGGIIATVNALASNNQYWTKSLLFGTAAGGTAAVNWPLVGDYLFSLSCPPLTWLGQGLGCVRSSF